MQPQNTLWSFYNFMIVLSIPLLRDTRVTIFILTLKILLQIKNSVMGCKSRLLVIEISAAIRDMPACKMLEYWSDGVLECWDKSRKRSDFYSFTFNKEGMTAGYQQP